jgi:hypothetical protein
MEQETRRNKVIGRKTVEEDDAVNMPRKILTGREESQVRLRATRAKLGGSGSVLGAVSAITTICLTAGFRSPVHAQTVSQVPNTSREAKRMTAHANGTFDVQVIPQEPDNKEAESSKIGRMSLDKQFHGDLDALSKGEMLGVHNENQSSGGYVAMERVSGTLHGRAGSFVLQHIGTMSGGAQQMTILVVPDSGTDQLVGLTGKMSIKVENGKHFYEFEYTLPESH